MKKDKIIIDGVEYIKKGIMDDAEKARLCLHGVKEWKS